LNNVWAKSYLFLALRTGREGTCSTRKKRKRWRGGVADVAEHMKKNWPFPVCLWLFGANPLGWSDALWVRTCEVEVPDGLEVEVPDGLGEPWATYRHEYGRPLNHVAARVTAGLMAENMDCDYWYENDENVAHDEQEFALQYIVLGLDIGDDSFGFSMVPISSVDKLDMFLDMIRLQWA